MRDYAHGSFQWDRAQTFLLQCEQPLRRDVEPAMLWRVLPPLVAHALQLPGRTPLALPWIGLLAATVYVAVLLRRQLDDTRFVFGGTLLFATTAAVLVPVGWLGMNDAWVWLGLLVVTFGRTAWSAPLACLLCPWVDERFIIGFPLAWLLARLERNEPVAGRALLSAFWLLPYAALRLALSQHDVGANESIRIFLGAQITQSFPLLSLAPLGWWMGLRAAWASVAYAVWDLPALRGVLVAGILFFSLGISFLLASDLSRSVAITTPLVLAGCLALARRHPFTAPKFVLATGVINLLIPAVHVVGLKIDPISLLPIELFRLLR